MFICEKEFDCVDCPRIYPSESCEHWIEVKEVVHGRWIVAEYDFVKCSVCGSYEDVWWADKGTNFCPNCGAKMDEVSK